MKDELADELRAASPAHADARARANDRGHLDDFRALDAALATLLRLSREWRPDATEAAK